MLAGSECVFKLPQDHRVAKIIIFYECLTEISVKRMAAKFYFLVSAQLFPSWRKEDIIFNAPNRFHTSSRIICSFY